jgi:hypothetical protein
MRLCIKILYLYVSARRMKGEDFEGLNLEGLQQLEKKLEIGLKRVIQMKVCANYYLNFEILIMYYVILYIFVFISFFFIFYVHFTDILKYSLYFFLIVFYYHI